MQGGASATREAVVEELQELAANVGFDALAKGGIEPQDVALPPPPPQWPAGRVVD